MIARTKQTGSASHLCRSFWSFQSDSVTFVNITVWWRHGREILSTVQYRTKKRILWLRSHYVSCMILVNLTRHWLHGGLGTACHVRIIKAFITRAHGMIGWRQRGYGFHHEPQGRECLFSAFLSRQFAIGGPFLIKFNFYITVPYLSNRTKKKKIPL